MATADHAGFACTQPERMFHIRSWFRCLLTRRYLWRQPAGDTYLQLRNVYPAKNRARYCLFLERTHLVTQWNYAPCVTEALWFSFQSTRTPLLGHTHVQESRMAKEKPGKESNHTGQRSLFCCCLRTGNSFLDPGLAKGDWEILTGTAFSGNHNRNPPVWTLEKLLFIITDTNPKASCKR